MISPKQRGIRLTDEEWEAVQQAAEREDRSAAEWSRVTLMRVTTQQPISPKQVDASLSRFERQLALMEKGMANRLGAMELSFEQLEQEVLKARYSLGAPKWLIWFDGLSRNAKTLTVLAVVLPLLVLGFWGGLKEYPAIKDTKAVCFVIGGTYSDAGSYCVVGR